MARTRARKVSAEVEGAEEIIEALKDMGQNAEDILLQAAEEGGGIALADAKRRCPEDTGRLKESLKLDVGKKTPIKADVRIVHGKDQYYGKFVELGTKNKPARPFLRSAVDENEKKISDKVADKICRAIRKAW